MTLWPAMAGIDAAMAGYGRYRCSYGPKTKIADVQFAPLNQITAGDLQGGKVHLIRLRHHSHLTTIQL